MDIITTSPEELHITYDNQVDPGVIRYNGVAASEFFATTISAKLYNETEAYNILALGDQDTEVGALIDSGNGAVMLALTDGTDPEEIVDAVTKL